ncbi:MAG TPA: hypothetical protein PKG60_09670 [Spirochaetota bacterium]|nr:hypothetical protein [Spirochaetota bacterium]HPS86221.1 hypothetical protein [Spirochaetota bacterium]
MGKFITVTGIIFILLSFAGCSTMKGTYVSITPLANTGFDPDHYATLGFAYTPDSDGGKLLKKELSAVFIEEQFKIISEKVELDAIQKTGIVYNKEVTIADAQKLGKIMKAKAMIIVNKTDFAGNVKASYISIDIVDTYGGVLVSAVYKGGENPDDINRAARSIVYRIQTENMKMQNKSEHHDESIVLPK